MVYMKLIITASVIGVGGLLLLNNPNQPAYILIKKKRKPAYIHVFSLFSLFTIYIYIYMYVVCGFYKLP